MKLDTSSCSSSPSMNIHGWSLLKVLTKERQRDSSTGQRSEMEGVATRDLLLLLDEA